MQENKQHILSRISLPTLIGESISLQKRGNFATGLCPFHEESTPSFYVYEDHYHCYGCGAHGDAISYVRKTQGLAFMESLRWLADKAGVPLGSAEDEKKYAQERKKKARENQVLLAAKDFFRACFEEGNKGEAARTYLETRRLPKAIGQELGIGYAPNTPDALYQHLRSLGFTNAEMEACSLTNQGRARIYDFFQNRLILPIRDDQGRLIAFTGRTLGDEVPKYKNSRFDKGSHLFGLDKARATIRQKSRTIVVEGHFDVLQMWAHSFLETVACQGTALTHEHLRKLGALTRQIILVFDGDTAGRRAALKVLDSAFSFSELHFKVVLLSPGEDPDSLLRAKGSSAMEELLAKAIDLLDFAISEKLREAPQTGIPDLIAKNIIPWLEQVQDPLRRAVYIQKISQQTGIAADLLHPKSKTQTITQKTRLAPLPQKDLNSYDPSQADLEEPPSPSLEREFIGHLYFTEPNKFHAEEVDQLLAEHLELQGAWSALVTEFLDCLRGGESPRSRELSLWGASQIPAVVSFLEDLRKRETAFDSSEGMNAFAHLRLEAKKKHLKGTLDDLKKQTINMKMQKVNDPQLWNLVTHSLVRTTQELESVDSLLRRQS